MSIKIKQQDMTDCGAACLASISAHYNLYIPISKIRQYAGTDKKGTSALGIVKAARKLGFEAKGVRAENDSLEDIPCPAIAHIIENKRIEHYIVIYKVTKEYISIMDPADGEIHKYTIETFINKWTNVLILLIPSETFEEKNEKISNYRRFLFLLKPHKRVITQAIFGAIVYTILGLSTSIYIQKITDNVLTNGNINLLNLLSISMILIFILQITIGTYKSIFVFKTGQKIDAKLILGYYKHILSLPQTFFDSMRVGEIISRINDAVKIRTFINDTSIGLIVNIFIIIFSFTFMFIYCLKLALTMLLVIPLYSILFYTVNYLNKKKERELMENAADLESQLVESINSIKTIKQLGIEEFANIKTETKFIKLLRTVYTSGMNSLFAGTSSEIINRLFLIILLWLGSILVINKQITPGQLLSFYALMGYFTEPVMSIIGMNKTVQNALIASDRMFEIMDLEADNKDENKIDINSSSIGNIRFENISFSYNSRSDIFQDFSFNINENEITAIIGESGSGKSTLASLIQKLYTIQKGSIYIGDYNINNLSNSSLKKYIGIIPQNLTLFSGTVVENIAVGEFNPNIKIIIDICSKLGISKFIEELPNGYNTYIGENGSTLSGGQRQRLAIARTLYRDPKVIIMDEATSALDSESEEYVQNIVKELRKKGKTIIIIAHRLSSVKIADNIIVLSNGQIAEQGSHKILISKKKKYYQMWNKQTQNIY